MITFARDDCDDDNQKDYEIAIIICNRFWTNYDHTSALQNWCRLYSLLLSFIISYPNTVLLEGQFCRGLQRVPNDLLI